MTFSVGERVRVKKAYRDLYDGATRGIVKMVGAPGALPGIKVQLNAGNPPERWVDPAHLEKPK